MKQLLIILLCTLSFTAYAQSATTVGEYETRFDTKDGNSFLYRLTLNSDNTFEFYRYRDKNCASCKEEHDYGKGNWLLKGKLIVLSSSDNLKNDKYTLNLDGSNARFIAKSPRDKSNLENKTRLQFYNPGKLFWLKGKELFKIK